jgi:Mn-dependent DtxR family transcriptional regulator
VFTIDRIGRSRSTGLDVHDQTESVFTIHRSAQPTHEFMALMLCVHRPSITVIARTLQQAGLIRYAQGKITVLDRDGLETTACDCYRTVRERFDQILGSSPLMSGS